MIRLRTALLESQNGSVKTPFGTFTFKSVRYYLCPFSVVCCIVITTMVTFGWWFTS